MARAALLLVVLLLAACASKADGGSPAADVVGEWELVSGTTSGSPLPQPAGIAATLVFDGAQAGGRSFCNHYSSGYTVDGASLRFEALGGTEMGCDPDVMAAETAFLTALASVEAFARDGEDLLLTGADVELRFRPIPPVPPSQLVGTDWVLESLIDGETASSVIGRSTLRLDDDGTFTAITACTTLIGRWQPTGDRVEFPEVSGSSRGCPPEVAAQEEHESAVLGTGFSVSIEEDRLTVLGDDGRGLVYLAEGGGDGAGGGAPTGDGLLGVWELRSGTAEGQEIRIPDQARGTIEFDGRRVGGTSFCNGFGGTYRLEGDQLLLEDVASTLVGCMGDVAAAEGAYMAVLMAPGLRVGVDEELVLTSDAGELRFTRQPPVPEAELVGTRWVLESIVQGATASSAVGEPAVLELAEDGTATFSTGCQTMTGNWSTRGDSVFLAEHEYDPTACEPALAEQDSLVTQSLSGGFQVSIDGDVLTVVDTDNRGAPGVTLTYRAG